MSWGGLSSADGKGFAPKDPALLLSQRRPAWLGAGQGLDSCHLPTLGIEIGFPAEIVSPNHNHTVPSKQWLSVTASLLAVHSTVWVMEGGMACPVLGSPSLMWETQDSVPFVLRPLHPEP